MRFPSAIAPTWNAIHNQVGLLHLQWKFQEQLFTNDKRRELLDHVAGTFFALVLQNFLLEVQLAIAKLGDPAKQGKHRNMTLATLVAEIRDLYSEPYSPEVNRFLTHLETDLATFKASSEKVRDRRNKYLAHLDYQLALGTHPVPITTPTRDEINGALHAVRELLHRVARHFQENPTAYTAIYAEGTAEHLVGVIKAGMRYFELLDAGQLDGDVHCSKYGDA
jgi:hypothetical protein